MAEYKGIAYLRAKLAGKQARIWRRYDYYEMKSRIRDLRISTPDGLQGLQTVLGWCAKAVDSVADRLVFRGFDNDVFDMWELYQMNNADVLFDSAILGALISSCDFIYISSDDTGFPLMQVIHGGDATGIMDPTTGMLTEGYAILEKGEHGQTLKEAYFVAGNTDFYEKGKLMYSRSNPAPYPLLVPIINRPDAKREFGHSRISRACMDIVDSAMRTVKRAEISAEFYSFPQKYLLGTDPNMEPMEKWRATISTMIEVTKDDDGDHPVAGQFQQQSMAPHNDQLRMFASLFAGETGLTVDDLGFVADNPASVDAIRASHENLRLIARKCQRTFGTGFLNAGYLAACVRDDYPYQRRQVYRTKPLWMPLFEPDAAALSGIGDAFIKLQQSFPDYVTEDKLTELTGI